MRRTTVTFEDETYAKLEQWAGIEIRPVASLVAAIAISCLRKELYPMPDTVEPLESPSKGRDNSESDLAKQSPNPAVISAWGKLIDGETLTPEEEELVAKSCDRAPHNVHNIVKKIRSKNGNGKAETKH